MQKTIRINEQDQKVAEFLKGTGVSYNVSFQDTKKDNNWVRDQFLVTFEKGKDCYTFDFFTGIGNRLEADKTNSKPLQELLGKDRASDVLSKIGGDWSKVYAVAPTQASVLYCLLSDAQLADQNFDDFCSEFGYDPDSRKDFKIYESCCETLQKIRKLFTYDQRRQLEEILQDY